MSGARRAAWIYVALVVGVAVAADCLASDRPIAMSLADDIVLFPNLGASDDDLRGEPLSRALGDGDWALWPPVRHSPTAVRTGGVIEPLAPPSAAHWLGTDDRGRDVLARLIHGARSTVVLVAAVALGALLIGLALAGVAVLGGGSLDSAVVAVADGASGIPAILMVVAAQGVWGSASLAAAAGLLIVPRAADTARIARAGLARALDADYAIAARSLGVGRVGVLLRHALPNAMPQIWVATALTAALVVLAEAALSFLGFGTPPPAASWGEILAQAHQNGLRWWLLLPPGIAVASLAGALGVLARTGR